MPKHPIPNRPFSELLRVSFKSADTEEWLDVHFTRPIGLVFAMLWCRLGVHPTVITVASMIMGAVGGCFFYFSEWQMNLIGVALVMLANFGDSTDGQMARLTNQKTLVGRVLDGFAENVWFFFIYWAIVLRLWPTWGVWIFLICCLAGFVCHSRQCALADYYRQIHLYFLLGKDGSELDESEKQMQTYRSLTREDGFWPHTFYRNYAAYCRGQERQTPQFQRLYRLLKQRYGGIENYPKELREEFRRLSLPLMKYTNLLTFNLRAITLYIVCLADVPWLYPLFEITVLSAMHLYMRRTHESFSKELANRISTTTDFTDDTEMMNSAQVKK